MEKKPEIKGKYIRRTSIFFKVDQAFSSIFVHGHISQMRTNMVKTKETKEG